MGLFHINISPSHRSQEEAEIRKQRSDHCKYKYLMLRNGIKVVMFPNNFTTNTNIAAGET